MKVKRLFPLALIVVLLATYISDGAMAATKPYIQKKLSVDVGKSRMLKVSGKMIKSKSFKSSDTEIARVSSMGRVTGLKEGTCKIVVTVKYTKNKKSKKIYKRKITCMVTVKNTTISTPSKTPEPSNYTSSEYYISSISGKKLDLSESLSGKVTARLTVEDTVKIWKDEREIAFSDLKPGQKIVATYKMKATVFPGIIYNCISIEVIG